MKNRKTKEPCFDPEAFLTQASGGRSAFGYRKDETVFRQGDAADAVFYIRSGTAKITVVSEQGREAVVEILGPGDFFGEGCLAGHLQRMTTASAMTDCVIVRMAKADIARAIHEEPKFSELFIARLLARKSRVEQDLADQLFNTSEKRLARVLLLLANYGEEGAAPVIPKISQQTLAEMIGTTRSRVSFFMNKFRRLGLIEYGDEIRIHQSLLSRILHEKPEIMA